MLKCDEILKEICKNSIQFAGKILSKSWLKFWKIFRENVLKFQENLKKWILQKF